MNGIINVLKPPGMTSSNVVVHLRRVLNIRKVGHTGTLDPGASGVLPICVGKATKLSDYIMSNKKTYRCEMVFGISTDTQDAYGKITNTSDFIPDKQSVISALQKYTGDILQSPPMYSAIKYKGKKLYELAREGKSVDVAPRKVTIYRIEIINYDQPNKLFIEVECSKGTYIRSLCSDIGEMLGCGAYMSLLIRTRSGNFRIEESHTLDEINECVLNERHELFLTPMDYLLTDLKAVYLPRDVYPKITNGNTILLASIAVQDEYDRGEEVRIYCDSQFIGLGYVEKKDNQYMLRVKKMLL